MEKGTEAHREIDEIYRQFSESYRTLDADKVVGLYAENVAYLQPNEDRLEGREKVREVFVPFFESNAASNLEDGCQIKRRD